MIRAPLAMGPICVAQIMANAISNAKPVPVFSKLTSRRSFIEPAPTVSEGAAKSPARLRATASVVKFFAAPPTIVKMSARGSETLKPIVRPNTSQTAVDTQAPIRRANA